MAVPVSSLALQSEQTFDWMHPSWRDLVIEHLAGNLQARHDFLARCGARGVILALSIGGGPEGKRVFPLVRDRDNWGHVRSAVCRVLETSDQRTAAEILSAVREALTPESQRAALHRMGDDQEKGMAESVLEACRDLWSTRPIVLELNVLTAYYELSAAHAPFAPSPDLNETWNVTWNAAREEFDEDGEEVEMETGEIANWARLTKLLSENEPRFLRYHEFPKHHMPSIDGFFKRARSYVEGWRSFDTGDEYQEEIAQLYYVGRAVHLLGEIVPAIEAFANSLSDKASVTSSNLEEEFNERFAKPDDEYEGGSPRSAGGFDVGEFFSDL